MLRTCHNLRRLHPICLTIFVRDLSQTEAQTALRPFYFAVHPDRFAKDPEVQSQNEKSLQVFNGYLNELYPDPSYARVKPVTVSFSILQKETGQYQKVSFSLSGTDPHLIVRTALERCKLSTDKLPKPPPRTSTSYSQPGRSNVYESYSQNAAYEPSSSHNFGPEFMDEFFRNHFKHREDSWNPYYNMGDYEYYDDLFEDDYPSYPSKHKKKRNKTRSDNLFVNLQKLREQALKKARDHQDFKDILDDSISILKQTTGVTDIVWKIDWQLKHMIQSLSGIKSMLKAVPKDIKEIIIFNLYRRKLFFGRGTYITVDGNVQFGADDVPEKWVQIIMNADQTRKRLTELNDVITRVQTMFNGASIIVDPDENLLQVLKEMNFIYTKHASKIKEDKRLRDLTNNSKIQIVSSYHELNLLKDGIIQVPNNVQFRELKAFMQEAAPLSKKLASMFQQELDKIEQLKKKCVNELKLASLSFDPSLELDLVQRIVKKLMSDERLKPVISDLHVHISSSSRKIQVTNEGKVSIPFE